MNRKIILSYQMPPYISFVPEFNITSREVDDRGEKSCPRRTF